jgi:alkyl sulfatase BDS1-like metallo-beta-lactamase superfamily hydrolase
VESSIAEGKAAAQLSAHWQSLRDCIERAPRPPRDGGPAHVEGRALLADALEQLGYQAESAPWRNVFLTGALELRHGVGGDDPGFEPNEAMARALPLESLFQTMAVRLDAAKAAGVRLHTGLLWTDREQPTLLAIERSVLHAFEGRVSDEPTVTLDVDSVDFERLIMGLTDAMALTG